MPLRGKGKFSRQNIKSFLLPFSFIDNFTRSNGSLGNTSDNKATWSVVRGNFNLDSNKAYSTSTADSMATALLASSNINNVQVDTFGDTGGMGIAIWSSDANSYWGIFPTYATNNVTNNVTNSVQTPITNSVASSSCSGEGGYYSMPLPTASCGYNCDIGVYCTSINCYCGDGRHISVAYGHYGGGNCAVQYQGWSGRNNARHNSYNNHCDDSYYCIATGGTCLVVNNYVTNYTYTTNYVTNYVTNTVTSAIYQSQIRIRNSSGIVHTNEFSANTVNPVRSIGVSTSGNVISYSAYSAANKGGSVLTTGTYDAGAGTKGAFCGIFKASSSHLQGSYLSNFQVTVV